ncbi:MULTISPECIES: hypothetical protein [unclassified Mesobacillus]|uniref:hypothetical protein n=1 Tax=unclassified Mesobacillus TaxID=2675270 RepID=UPI00203ED777|nr:MULTISPECIES: hypothetical protein [unclassified Mesobacillus]MCM3122825.1 hypothetical protein [Mesobacillus sp. MER 33]MCM3233692.1 hypothetical protein [Mesobacillus sp. MER 48]
MNSPSSKFLLFGALLAALLSFILGTKLVLLSAGLLLANAVLIQSVKQEKVQDGDND